MKEIKSSKIEKIVNKLEKIGRRVDVDPYFYFRLPTDELELRLGGGWPKGTIAIVEGDASSGKTILCERLMYGFLKNNASVTYVSTEYSFSDFFRNMRSLNYDVTEYIFMRKLSVYPLFPIFSRLRKDINFLRALLNAKYLFSKDIFILDSLSFFTFRQKITKFDILYMLELFKKVCASNRSVIITLNPNQMEDTLVSILREVSDIYLYLTERTVGGSPSKYIIVKRFKCAKSSVTPIISYRVDPNVGFLTEVVGFV